MCEKGIKMKKITDLIASLSTSLILSDDNTKFKNGDKVKININRIQDYKDYHERTDTYKLWVKAHKNDIFTIEILKQYKVLCTFKEDTSDPKWVFWLGDLIKI